MKTLSWHRRDELWGRAGAAVALTAIVALTALALGSPRTLIYLLP